MKTLVATGLLAIMSTLAIASQVQAQDACDLYRVKAGDSLKKITERVYGHSNFNILYNANKAEIGRNPNIIEVGMILQLPCADGSLPDASARNERNQFESDHAINFVTANGYLPYTDESMDGQGIFTILVERAMLRAAPKQEYKVTFVNDWAAHFDALLPSGAFDASFPWSQPNCESLAGTSNAQTRLCENYVFSAPFYEIVEGFFARTGSGYDNVIDAFDYQNARFCRPEGYPSGHFAELGLLVEEAQLVQPYDVASCFKLLNEGAVDVVSLDTRSGTHAVQSLGLTQSVSENKNLAVVVPLQVALLRENPNSTAIIETLNAGLLNLHETGEWHAIISQALEIDVNDEGAAMN